MNLPASLSLTREDNIAILAMVNKTNILGPTMISDLIDAFHALDKDPDVKIIIFTGNGAKSFIAGSGTKASQKS